MRAVRLVLFSLLLCRKEANLSHLNQIHSQEWLRFSQVQPNFSPRLLQVSHSTPQRLIPRLLPRLPITILVELFSARQASESLSPLRASRDT